MQGVKMYEFECERSNVTPKQFFNYVCKQYKLRTGMDFEWLGCYEDFSSPCFPEKYHTNYHKDWDEPLIEGYGNESYDLHWYLEKSYNFIMEFQFWDEFKGFGYCYIIEYER